MVSAEGLWVVPPGHQVKESRGERKGTIEQAKAKLAFYASLLAQWLTLSFIYSWGHTPGDPITSC